MEEFYQNNNVLVYDTETLTYNKGHPFDPRNKLISYAYLYNDCINFHYHSDPDFSTSVIRNNAQQQFYPNLVGVGFNVKFDWHWLPLDESVKVWDCQLAEHIYTGQKASYISLNECLTKYDLETKLDIVKDFWDAGVQTNEIPIHILEEYNKWDVQQNKALFDVQQTLLSEKQKNLVYLLGEDLKVLAHIERAGIKFDADGARVYLGLLQSNIKELEKQLAKWLPVIEHGTFNWDSGDHLSCYLYGGTLNFDYFTETPAVYKSGEKKGQEYIRRSWHVESVLFKGFFKPLDGTEVAKTKDKPDVETRFYQTDAPTLASLKGGRTDGKQIIELLTKRSEAQKVCEMLESLFKQFETKGWTDNLIHATYNQNVAVTGRLSSSSPNMQNTPPEVDKFLISRYDD